MRVFENYPEVFTADRNIIEGSFVFCLWKNPELFVDYMKILKPEDDFLLPETRFYYAIGIDMYKLGYVSYDNASIVTYLESKKELHKIFNDVGGYQAVSELKDIVDAENVDAYYDSLVKNNMLIDLYDNGFDLTRVAGKFKDMNSQQAHDYCDYIITNSLLKNANGGMKMVDLASGYDEWVKEWDKGTSIGYRVGFPMLNYHLAGIHKKNLILHVAGIGQGKAQPLYSKILTPSGYVEMRDIKVGDEIFGDDGKVHNVVGVFPQGEKDVYEITFSDGSKTRSCDEHLWTVQDYNTKRHNQFKTLMLKEIINDRLYCSKSNGTVQWKYNIPMTQPIEFDEKELEIPPYILGLLLGDGHFRDKGSVMISMSELDIIKAIKGYCDSLGMEITTNNGTCFRLVERGCNTNKIKDKLRVMNLIGVKSHEKFIPQEYLINSIQNRIDLLSGLIDTDGEVNGNNYTFSTTSPELKNSIVFLVQSLGGTAKVEDRQTYYTYKDEKKAGKPSYRVSIKLPKDIQAFKSEKHKNKFKTGQRESRRYIREIKYIGKEETQCIMTSNPSQLYLTDDMIVTHNTTSAILMYVLPILESGESICILANEQDEEQFRQMLLATVLFNRIGYTKMNRQKFLFGGFSDDDKVAIKKAIDWLAQYEGNLHYGHLEDYRTETIKRVVKKYSKIGVGAFLVDTLKPEDEMSDKSWAAFSETSKDLFLLSQKEDVAIVCTAQLSGVSANRQFLDLSCIGKSKAIAETAGQVLMFRPLRLKEKETLQVYNYAKDSSGKYSKVKSIIPLDVDKDYIVLFVAKNRYGKGGDLQIVYERNMDFNTMKEIGYTHIEYDGYGR